MRPKTLTAIIIIIGLFFSATVFVQAAPLKAPLAHVSVPDYQFDQVLDGDEVLHEFVINNKGDADLKIEKVRTG